MTKRTRTVMVGTILVAMALLLAAGCGGQQEDTAGVEPTVVYGGSAWLGHYPAMIGIEKGFFADEGLRVIFQGFYTSSGRMGSLAAGQLDFASTGSISALALMASGNTSFYALGSQDSYATVEGIVARTGIEAIEDLAGTKLAVTFASSAHVLVYDILEQHGLDPESDVELVNLSVYDMISAFKSREIDAAAAWTPAFEQLLALDDCHLLCNDESFSLYKEYELGPGPDLLVARADFVDEHPDLTEAFLRGYFKAIEFLQDPANLDEAAEVISEYTKLDVEAQKETLRAIAWHGLDKQFEFMVDPGTYIEGLEKLAAFLVEHGMLETVPDIQNYVNVDVLPD